MERERGGDGKTETREADRQKQRQTNRQTGRQKDRQDRQRVCVFEAAR